MIGLNLILLLQLIHTQGNVNELLRRGLTFSQISDLIEQAIDNGLILRQPEPGGIILTDQGMLEVERLRRSGKWILPRDDLRVEKIPKDEIYLPSKKNSFFGSR